MYNLDVNTLLSKCLYSFNNQWHTTILDRESPSFNRFHPFKIIQTFIRVMILNFCTCYGKPFIIPTLQPSSLCLLTTFNLLCSVVTESSHRCGSLTRNVLVFVLLEMAVEVGLLTKTAVAQVTFEWFLLIMDIADVTLKVWGDAEWAVTVFTPSKDQHSCWNMGQRCSSMIRGFHSQD